MWYKYNNFHMLYVILTSCYKTRKTYRHKRARIGKKKKKKRWLLTEQHEGFKKHAVNSNSHSTMTCMDLEDSALYNCMPNFTIFENVYDNLLDAKDVVHSAFIALII